MTTADKLAEVTEFNESDFQDWLHKDEIKMLLSTIPKTNNNETFVGLLHSAFKSGFGLGQAKFGIALMREMIMRRD